MSGAESAHVPEDELRQSDILMSASRAERIGTEIGKSIDRKIEDGFVARYLSGSAILDIGYRGYRENVEPVVPQAIGIELDYPGYDGRTLTTETSPAGQLR